AEAAFAQVMRGESTAVQMSALLMGLRSRGEAAAEVVGAVRALRKVMQRLSAPKGKPLVDTCGTGGGKVTTFNISTAAAFVAAGAGARVAKHGNRSFTSRSGSADVLEALGVVIPADAGGAAVLLERCDMTFMFAPLFHPAMRHVGPIRRELGIGTIMNILGPLANPAGVTRQVIGVADPARAQLIADALPDLGCEWALVVHARVGMDEIAPWGETDVWEVKDGKVKQWTLEPRKLGLDAGSPLDLAGGLPSDNATMIRGILSGKNQAGGRTAVLLNAAAALLVAGLAEDFPAAIKRAADAIDSGAAQGVLEKLVRESKSKVEG
ncbi:MAG: anthranilate phosphoribosyltransferase, partial [Gemmatimonadales bacterium]